MTVRRDISMTILEKLNSDLESSNEIENRIIEAFMILYADIPIEKISIKKITDLAGLNRGTFYLHYLDIYDLLEKIEARYYAISRHIAIVSVGALFDDEILEDALPSREFYLTNLKYYKILLCADNKSNLSQVMKDELKKAFRDIYDISEAGDNELTEYALEFITAAQVAIIIRWIKNDLNISLKKLSGLMKSLTAHGALGYFRHK